MSNLQKTAEYADYLIEAAHSRPEKLLDSGSINAKWKSIHHRLLNFYLEENRKQSRNKNVKCGSHLLDKLVKRDHLNTLVVNLYPGNDGYSLLLKARNGADSETIRLPYEESEFLEYIDAEEMPPLLVDLLDTAQTNIFYSGCVIVEVRDYRRNANNSYDSRCVLLRPTPHTLLCDMNAVTNDGHRWTQEDTFNLESQLLIATNEPLCLDPSPLVYFVANKMNYEKHKLSTQALKRSVKKFSQQAVNRKRKMAQCPAPRHLQLHDFVTRSRDKLKSQPPVNLKVGKAEIQRTRRTCVDMWRQKPVQLTTPETIDVEKYAKVFEKPKQTIDNTPVMIEEYTFETERSHGKVNYSKLNIVQRLSDEFYSGELYVDRNYVESLSQGSVCRFPLGTKANVEKYIAQFREIFTEEGRKQVKITHQVPGQPPTVSYTQTVQAAPPVQVSSSAPVPQPVQTTTPSLAGSITGQIGITNNPTENGVNKKAPPIRLSLSLNPNMTVSAGNFVTPQGTPSQGQATAQLTLNIQQQQLATAQRIRQMGIYANIHKSAGTLSPVSTPTGTSQLPTYSQATGVTATSAASSPQLAVGVQQTTALKIPTPSPTPPSPAGTPTPPTGLASRRSSLIESMATGQPVQTGFLQSGSAPSTPSTPSSLTSDNCSSVVVSTNHSSMPTSAAGPQGMPLPPPLHSNMSGPPPNVNIGNLSSLPQNINIQNLTAFQGLHNLQNVQVSLGGMTIPGGIALPVPLSMINTNPTLTPPAGILVSSLPGVQTVSAVGSTRSSSTATLPSPIQQAGGTPVVTSPHTYVTMVTAVPSSSVASTSTTSSTATCMPTTTGLITSSGPTVLSATSGLLPLPIGMTQFVTTTGIKAAPGLRHGAPLQLCQIQGQHQPVQLLSTSLAPPPRSQLTAQHQTRSQGPHPPKHGTTQPISVTSGIAQAPNLTAQPVGALSQIRSGQPPARTAQQFLSLRSQHPSQPITHLTLQQPCQTQPALLHHKPRSKKRTTSTPPKS